MAVRPLCPELAAKAFKELNENPKRVPEDIQYIKDWIRKQDYLVVRQDDQWILGFLRGCKFSLEKTKSKIDFYYTIKSLTPEFSRCDFRNVLLLKLFDTGFVLPLSITDGPDGPRIVLVRPGLFDPNKCRIEDVVKTFFGILQMVFNEDDNIAVSGMMLIFDLRDLTMGHILMMSPSVLKKLIIIGTGAAPFRQRDSHFINAPSGFETLYNVAKTLIKRKKQTLHLHKDPDSLFKHVPQMILPSEYGGKAGSLEDLRVKWRKKILEYEEWFSLEDTLGTDESKRPGEAKTAEALFGVEGSFRQLQLD